MTINRMIITACFAVLASPLCAGTMGTDDNADGWWNTEEPCVTTRQTQTIVYPWMHVATFSIGPGLSNNNGRIQTFYLQPEVEKTYAPTPARNALLIGQLFLGMQKQLAETFIGQFGIGIAGATDARLAGDIWEDADPAFNNYTYQYSVDEARVTLNGKLLMDIHYHKLLPYVAAGLGVGFNSSHGFSLTPDIYEEVPHPFFQKNTNTAFTYTMGIGVHKILNDYWQMGIGYEFADWGKSQLAAAPGQTLNAGISLTHLYVSSLQLSTSVIM